MSQSDILQSGVDHDMPRLSSTQSILQATCAEVAIDHGKESGKDGNKKGTKDSDAEGAKVRIVRVVQSFDCGAIVNPTHLKNQIEGAITMAIGGALFEAIQFENGRVLNPRFSVYRVPRFADTPSIEVVLLDRKDIPSARRRVRQISCRVIGCPSSLIGTAR